MSKRFREAMAVLVALLVATGVAFAAASYPTSVKSFPTRVTGDVISATFFNDPQDEITAIEQGLLNGFAHVLRPDATANNRDIGLTTAKWRDMWLSGKIDVAGNGSLFRSLAGTVNILTVAQGDNNGAVTPTQAALIGQAWLAPTDNNSFDALQGTAYALAGNRGFIQGVRGVASSTTTPASTWGTTGTAAYGFIGVLGEAIGSRAGARIWAGNFLARSETVGIDDVSGVEIDLDTRTAIGNRYGLSIVANATGTVQATSEDMMIRLVNKTGGAQWKDGLAFGGSGGVFPIATTGALVRSIGAATVATGIDLSSLTISGNALKFANFTLTGAGVVTVGAGTPFTLYGGTGATALSTTTTEFLAVSGIAAPVAAEGNIFQLVERAGSIMSARALLSDAPGGTATRTLTLMQGGVATGLTIAFGSADTAKTSTGGPITVAAGDVLTWRSTLTGTPVASRVQGVTLRMRETAL